MLAHCRAADNTVSLPSRAAAKRSDPSKTQWWRHIWSAQVLSRQHSPPVWDCPLRAHLMGV